MLEVALADDDIKKALLQYNYDDNILAEGKKILAEGDQLAKEVGAPGKIGYPGALPRLPP
jgi:hypothetical protein